MTLDEYKAWLDGFSEGVNGAPTETQWKKIRDKLNQVYSLKYSSEKWPFGNLPNNQDRFITPTIQNPLLPYKDPYYILC